MLFAIPGVSTQGIYIQCVWKFVPTHAPTGHSHILQAYTVYRIQVQTPRYKSRRPNTPPHTSPTTQKSSPDIQVQIQTHKIHVHADTQAPPPTHTSPNTQKSSPDISMQVQTPKIEVPTPTIQVQTSKIQYIYIYIFVYISTDNNKFPKC